MNYLLGPILFSEPVRNARGGLRAPPDIGSEVSS